jgi:subtilisin family serine protease
MLAMNMFPMRSLTMMSALAVGVFGAWPTAAVEVDAVLLAKAAQDKTQSVLLVLPEQGTPVLAPLRQDANYLERRVALVDALRARADASQAALRDWLDRQGIAHRDYWIANLIEAQLTPRQLQALMHRKDLLRIASNASLPQALPVPDASAKAVTARPWGIDKINAPQAWAAGVSGQGITVAGADTGYQWDHPALKPQYRGCDGSNANHAYNWHDAIHDGSNVCGINSPFPCDDHGHGTHTMGTMVGTVPGGDVIGVAPQARWIACRNMGAGWGTPARYIECMQWFMAPTDSANQNPDPSKAPDVINNSWGCTVNEGCTTGEELRAAVNNVIAGGILFVVSAGNDGASCSTILDSPATYEPSFTVAATNSADSVVNFSSRGPVAGAESVTLDIAAPGASVYSSVRNGGYQNMSGTSMAGPHVAGVAALVMSAAPSLRGHPDQVAAILRASTQRSGITDPSNTGCGGLNMSVWPNWQAGYGRLDAWTAVQMARAIVFRNDFES